jgi:hypothetical protein
MQDRHTGIYNLCSGQPVRLKEFLSSIARQLKSDLALCHFGAREMRSFETPFNGGDPAKFVATFAPEIDLSLGAGIEEFVKRVRP